ncbi:hypothetical protein LR68_01009 [Anoxybacillus sp. BCO1]|nr:hypothetical protein LR68_01009 [Anoxybacillus sp. BCO1]
MKQGIISLGEALIDFIPLDATNRSYQKSPGERRQMLRLVSHGSVFHRRF